MVNTKGHFLPFNQHEFKACSMDYGGHCIFANRDNITNISNILYSNFNFTEPFYSSLSLQGNEVTTDIASYTFCTSKLNFGMPKIWTILNSSLSIV